MYCCNCGVRLADTEHTCPLCGTAAYHPDIPRPRAEPLYPANKLPPRVSSRGAQIIATAVFLLPMAVTLQCDLLISGRVTWSGYVIGALAAMYAMFVLPGWFCRPNPAVFSCVDFTMIALLLLYINWETGGDWFLTFALPVTGGLGLLVTALVTLLRYVRRGVLYIAGGFCVALGAFIPLVEYLLHVTFAVKFTFWSGYPLTVLVILGGMLIFLAINRRAREKWEKRFFI